MKLYQRLFPTKPPVKQEDYPETVRSGIFSTSHNPGNGRLSLMKRQQIAMSRTFQRSIDSIKPVNLDGTPAVGIDYAMDEAYPDLTQAKLVNSSAGYIPIEQLEWYANQGFIGWQMCGLLAQNWLIDKICGVPAQDCVRKGYDITLNDGTLLDPKVLNEIRLHDKRMNIKGKLKMFIKKGRIFGIRHALFIIDGIDYALPFNPDGIKPGSYRGITQIDPYWMAPILGAEAAANPASPEFYEPTWWLINGQRIHRSHFVIMRSGDEVVDILKPAYLYGGIPIPQKIYERVYAAERSANEAPLLLLSKRMTTLKTDTTEIFAPNSSFSQQMVQWGQWQNNFGIKVVDRDDEVQQFETAMGEVNETINTQFALVCSAGNCPVTKIMGTPPKGMDATGEYDEANYHEEIESLQEEIGTPFVERHHLCLMRSYIAPKFSIAPLDTEINWKPLDSYTTKEQAEINKIKADTSAQYVTMGAVDGFDVRQGLITDPDSGYNGIDPVVPDGPGDREHEQEVAAKALENESKPDNEVMDFAMDDEEHWITVNGAHVKIDENGKPIEGAGGNLDKPDSPHEGKRGHFEHKGKADLKKQGFKPKKRGEGDNQTHVAQVAWTHAINTGKIATAQITGRGWAVLRPDESVAYATPHMTVNPEGVVHRYNPKFGGDEAQDSALYAGVMYRAGDKILLMKRAPDKMNGDRWSFPAGNIEEGETSLDAALREFFEETGKRITQASVSCDIGDFVLYSVYGDEFVPMIDREHTAYGWFSTDELPEPLHPGVRDQITMATGSVSPTR